MKMNKLDKSVLKLWYIRAAIGALALVGVVVGVLVILLLSEVARSVTLAVSLSVGISAALLLCIILIMPVLRYKMYAWGYDDKRIIVLEAPDLFRNMVVVGEQQYVASYDYYKNNPNEGKLSGLTIMEH